MEECFTQPLLSAERSQEVPSVATGTSATAPNRGPKETTLAALRSFARAYRAVTLVSMPDAPGMVLN